MIALIGPPAAGKGTLARFLLRDFGLETLSVGDLLLRDGRYSRADKCRGLLADDALVKEVVAKHWHPRSVLDGFPRTGAQAQMLGSLFKPTVPLVFHIHPPIAVLEERIRGRLMHEPSGRTYHSTYNPPLRAGLDDVTGEPLVGRDDDDIDVFRRRLADHHRHVRDIQSYITLIEPTEHYSFSNAYYDQFLRPWLLRHAFAELAQPGRDGQSLMDSACSSAKSPSNQACVDNSRVYK